MLLVLWPDDRLPDAREHAGEGEEGGGVEQEEPGEAGRVSGGGDQPADRGAEAYAEVHADPLERVGGVPVAGRGQPSEQRGLAGPETGGARALEGEQREGVPRLPDQREEREGHGLQQQSEQKRVAPADAIDGRASHPARPQRGHSAERERQPGHGERDPSHVVEVDDDERQHDPVPERVDDPADLYEPDLARQVRIELAEVASTGI